MLSTKNLITDYKEINERWIFEYYCRLGEKLTGQDLKIKSVFNEQDKTPSMCIYTVKPKEEDKEENKEQKEEEARYFFKDFSTGKYGSAIDLVKELTGLDFVRVVNKIVADYNKFVLKNEGAYVPEEFKEHSKYKVTSHTTRSWNTDDQKQWTQYNIGSKLLKKYNVVPLESYVMSKTEKGVEKSITITGKHIYGYLTKSGELYKIYQPHNKEKKFIKIKSHLQGVDQLENYKYLMITSSLKDIMSIKSLNLRLDLIAADSENVMIPEQSMKLYLKKYKKVIVLFDNDEAGIKAMKKYRDKYSIPVILLTLAKDPSDAIKSCGVKKVKERLVPLIDSKLCEL